MIDSARVAAVCTNVNEASQLVDAGVATDQAAAALRASIAQLVKPPLVAPTLRLAHELQRDVRRHHLTAAVNAGLAWCTQQGQ